jgi:hypothetical protein
MVDKLACHAFLPLWATAAFQDGTGNDRLIFDALHKKFTWAVAPVRSVYYVLNPPSLLHEHHAREFRQRNIAWISDRTLVEKAKTKMKEAQCHWQNGAIAETIECSRAVLAIHRHHSDALHLLALAEHKAGESMDARKHLDEAIAIDDRKQEYFASLALLLSQTGDAVGAERALFMARRRSALRDG